LVRRCAGYWSWARGWPWRWGRGRRCSWSGHLWSAAAGNAGTIKYHVLIGIETASAAGLPIPGDRGTGTPSICRRGARKDGAHRPTALTGICNAAEASCGLLFNVGFACVFATRVGPIGAAEFFTYVAKQRKVIEVDDAAISIVAIIDSTVGTATALAVGLVQDTPGQLAYHPILLEMAAALALALCFRSRIRLYAFRQRYTLD